MSGEELAWLPDACTLPTVDRPVRLAEFDELFAVALRGQQRLSPTVLRWLLDPAAESAARDLTARESSCCSFFSFTFSTGSDFTYSPGSDVTFSSGSDVTFSPGSDAVRLDVRVPAAQVEILDGLAQRAAAGMAA